MQRNKTIAYDDDDLYPSDEDYYEEDSVEYTEEDKANFASLTPVVRAEVEEAGLQASDREIQDALWDSYWDVAEAVRWLRKNAKGKSKGGGGAGGGGDGEKKAKEKAGSRFDQAAERSKGVSGGEFETFLLQRGGIVEETGSRGGIRGNQRIELDMWRRGGLIPLTRPCKK